MNAVGLYVVGVVILLFGVIGFARGWFREVAALAGLVLGWMLVLLGGRLLVALVDRVYLMVAYTARGGFDAADPGALLRQLRDNPLVDPAHPDPLYAIVFALVVIAAYGGGTRYAPAPESVAAQLLGVPIGLMNGYLLAYALLRYVGPVAVGDDLIPLTNLVGRYVTPVLAVGSAVVAGLALALLRGRTRGARVARSLRARGRS